MATCLLSFLKSVVSRLLRSGKKSVCISLPEPLIVLEQIWCIHVLDTALPICSTICSTVHVDLQRFYVQLGGVPAEIPANACLYCQTGKRRPIHFHSEHHRKPICPPWRDVHTSFDLQFSSSGLIIYFDKRLFPSRRHYHTRREIMMQRLQACLPRRMTGVADWCLTGPSFGYSLFRKLALAFLCLLSRVSHLFAGSGLKFFSIGRGKGGSSDATCKMLRRSLRNSGCNIYSCSVRISNLDKLDFCGIQLKIIRPTSRKEPAQSRENFCLCFPSDSQFKWISRCLNRVLLGITLWWKTTDYTQLKMEICVVMYWKHWLPDGYYHDT